MSDKNRLAAAAVAIVVIALLGLTWGLGVNSPAQAAPNALVTPVTVYAGGVQVAPATFWSGTGTIADGGSTEIQVGSHEKIDLQAVVDVGVVNTTTLKLQFSNDGTNWIDGATFGTALVADANTMQQYQVYGRYVRAYADVTNASPITLTVIGVLR
jgi:hypothetical protein